MSNDIHPNWHTTDDEELVPVHGVTPKQESAEEMEVPVHTTSVSRRPAAIVGILLVVGISTLFYQGVQNLTGQLSGGMQIHITETGFQPQDISVAPGQQITWINDLQMPQYIISDTLCSLSGECLNTPTMFQEDQSSFTVPSDIAAGTYTYYSPTDVSLSGTINVSGGAEVPQSTPPETTSAGTTDDFDFGLPDMGDEESVDAFSFAQQSLLDSIQRQLELDSTETAAQETRTPEPATTTPSGIAQNPYTVGSNRQFPFDSEGDPIPSYFGDSETSVTAQVAEDPYPTFGTTTQKPFRQPETGSPGLWLILALSTLGIYLGAIFASPVVKA